ERFTSPSLRAKHQTELLEILEAIFAEHDSNHWLAEFRKAGVPCAPINTYSEVLQDEQVEHMNWVQNITLPNGVQTRTFASPIKLNGEGQPVYMSPPALGQNNQEILEWLAKEQGN